MFGEHELTGRGMPWTWRSGMISRGHTLLEYWDNLTCNLLPLLKSTGSNLTETQVSNYPSPSPEKQSGFALSLWYLQCRDHVIPSDSWSVSVSSSSNTSLLKLSILQGKDKVLSHCSHAHAQTPPFCSGVLQLVPPSKPSV